MSKQKETEAQIKEQIMKEIEQINQDTHDYIASVMQYVKKHPQGLKSIERYVHQVAKNMDHIEDRAKAHLGV